MTLFKATFSRRHRFSDWPNTEVPSSAAGVYAIWEGETLIYCGMSGRRFEANSSKPRYGLITRLGSHATGRLSGDQFCVYVANRLVIPTITPAQMPDFASGALKLDTLTRAYIHERFEYQFAIVQSSAQAYELERCCRQGLEFGMRPVLNPLQHPIG